MVGSVRRTICCVCVRARSDGGRREMKDAVEGRRGESRRRGRYDHDGRQAGSRGTTSPYRHRNTDYKGRRRWERAGRSTAQCCPTSTAELNVSRTRATRPRGGGPRIVHAALTCACRPALFSRTFLFISHIFATVVR